MTRRGALEATIYRDTAGEWRWRMERGGRIVADGSEGYSRRASAERAVWRFAAGVKAPNFALRLP